MAKWKDVAHLYWGCQCKVAVVVPGQAPEWEDEPWTLGTRLMYNIENERFQTKPILRPLSSVTVGEFAALTAQEMPSADYMNWKFNTNSSWNPVQTHWLLSNGYDLFDLLPSGQAIDATTIKNEQQ